eukprot:TRINITY_DN6606_c0_g2_i3.p1 TRINITY_DN6606_c0_g2~~TRINITY_DN6606_c0_g2_i3.p1  ORF type:complete len:433 (+),score=72.50 TRINITY_DN6606_c0_g2_i3:778-2076(+)
MTASPQLSEHCVTQSLIGDCSFICSLVVAVNFEKVHKQSLICCNIYPQNSDSVPIYNPDGLYLIKLHWNGVWRQVVIDDWFPVAVDGSLLVAHSNNRHEIWVSVLEKAYMKLKGGYLSGSDGTDDLKALFGWIPEKISLHPSQPLSPNAIWDRLYFKHQLGQCMLLFNTREMGEDTSYLLDQVGLACQHTYACLEMRFVKGFRLVKLKNPWTRFRWCGAFSVSDGKHWTEEMQKELNYDIAIQGLYDNGIFWILWEDLCTYFGSICVAWSPRMFYHNKVIHGRVEAIPEASMKKLKYSEKGMSFVVDYSNYAKYPHFRLEIEGNPLEDTNIFLHLERHRTGYESQNDAITIDVHQFNGRRIHNPSTLLFPGVYTLQNNYQKTLSLSKGSGKNYTVVVSHSCPSDNLTFSLFVYSESLPFKISPISDSWFYLF